MSKSDGDRVKILGVEVDSTSESSVLEIINNQCSIINKKGPFFIVTAYSEFFLQAQKDIEFKNALDKADLIVPDGVSVVAAMDYLQTPGLLGIQVGLNILQGKYYDKTVVGVKLVRQILESKHKIFLVGAWNNEAERLAKKYHADYDDFSDELTAVKKINKSAPDILLVALGRFKQEKWIAKNLKNLKCKVVIGVGSAFDEILGEGIWRYQTPVWVEKMGLKWLWRVFIDPSHIIRAWNAFPVFAWKVFLQKNFSR